MNRKDNKVETIIVGAGLAGLLTACRIDGEIWEKGPWRSSDTHKALLRFRDQSVSVLTGIPFREVTVRKEIYCDGDTFQQCSIALANQYSRKVTGIVQGRSIWNLDTVKRYVAPEDFQGLLFDRFAERIHWDKALDWVPRDRGNKVHLVSTAPLPVMLQACGLEKDIKINFERAAIKVDRYRIPNCDVFQTIYFPEGDMRVFRASITGDILIVESMTGQPRDHFEWAFAETEEFAIVMDAFGLTQCDMIDTVEQKYGKIVELKREDREAILYELTRDFNVFSIGRFAQWRNILLDDVAKDIGVVERLLAANDYHRARVLAARG